MPTPTRVLTNDHKDCKLVKLDAGNPTSPYVIMQEGYIPGDPTCRMRMFYLQRDGFWIDEVARSTRPDTEIGDVVYESSAEAMQVLAGLFGRPLVRALPTTEADVQAYATRMRSISSPEAALREFLSRYRAAKGVSK